MLVTFVVIVSAVLLSRVSSSSDKCQVGCNDLFYPPHDVHVYGCLMTLYRHFDDFDTVTVDINCTSSGQQTSGWFSVCFMY